MMTDKQRKGSLAWRKNSKKGYRIRVPVVKKNIPHVYYVKAKTTRKIIEGVLSTCTILKQVPMKKEKENYYRIEYSKLKVKRAIKRDVFREITGSEVTTMVNQIENSPKRLTK